MAAVKRAIAEVEGRLAMLRYQKPDGEMSQEAEELEAQLHSLTEQRVQIERAPAGQLGKMKLEVSAGLSATRLAAEGVAVRGHQQIAMHVAEMHAEEISAVMSRHDKAAAEFRQYEQRSARRIDELAAERGIDVTSVRDNRFRLLAERMAAEARGDRAGVYKSDALLAYNNVDGLKKVGAPQEEIEKGEREANEARERYLKERELQALSEGRKAGITGEALRSHVDGARSRAATEFDEEQEKARRKHGLTSATLEEAMKERGHRWSEWSRERAASTAGEGVTAELALKGRDDEEILRAEEARGHRESKKADDAFAATPKAIDEAKEAAAGLKGVTAERSEVDQTNRQTLPNERKAVAAAKG